MIAPRYLRHLFIGIAAWVAIFLAFTWIVDPYGVSPLQLSIPGLNVFKPARVDIDRQLKPYEVWRYQPKTVFLGTSRIHQSIDPAILDGTKFAPAYNASVPASEMSENAALLEHFFSLDKNLRYVFVELFLYNFTRPQLKVTPISFGKFRSDAIALHMSASVAVDALRTMRVNLFNLPRRASVAPSGYWIPPVTLNTRDTFNAELNVDTILRIHKYIPDMIVQSTATAALDRIVDLCRRNGAELYLFITPNYPWDDYRLLSLGYWPLLERWLNILANYDNVFSFSQYNRLLEDPPGENMNWWYDPIHFNREFGRMILRSFLGQKDRSIPDNLLRQVTPATVDDVLKERFNGQSLWNRKNSEYVNLFENAKRRIMSPPPMIDGHLGEEQLVIDGTGYTLVERIGGAIEHLTEWPDEIQIDGWAADHENNKPAIAVVATVGDKIVARAESTRRRRDIEGGIGSGVRPAGFSILVPLPTARDGDLPIVRLFALTADGKAVQLASALPPGRYARLEARAFPAR